MNIHQTQLVFSFMLLNLATFSLGFWQTKYHKNAYGITYPLVPLGIFVWGDAVLIGLFWVIVSAVCLLLGDWILFLLFISVFWLARSIGEAVYYFIQQFSTIERQKPESLPGFSVFQNDSIWFAYQVICQLIAVTSLILSVYLFSLWL